MPDPAALASTGPADPGRVRTVLATVVDTPIGPLSLLARDGRLIAGGFTADPAGMHARLDRKLRTLPLETAGPGDLPWLVKPIARLFRRRPAGPGRDPGASAGHAVPAAAVGRAACRAPRPHGHLHPAGRAGRLSARAARGRGGVCPQPDRARGPVPPRAAHGRQPRRVLLRPGSQDVAASPRGGPGQVAWRAAEARRRSQAAWSLASGRSGLRAEPSGPRPGPSGSPGRAVRSPSVPSNPWREQRNPGRLARTGPDMGRPGAGLRDGAAAGFVAERRGPSPALAEEAGWLRLRR